VWRWKHGNHALKTFTLFVSSYFIISLILISLNNISIGFKFL
jgi:hypothetical protein